MKRREVKKTDC